MPRPLRVFLCHASQDKPAVRKLHRYLKQHGIQPWLDQEDLLPGEDWEVAIPEALLTSDVIIVCLSRNSVDKEGYIQKEISFALDKALEKPGKIFIIPVKFEECDIPKRLRRYQCVDITNADGRKRLLMGLNKRVAELVDDVRQIIFEDMHQRIPLPKTHRTMVEKQAEHTVDVAPIEESINEQMSEQGASGRALSTKSGVGDWELYQTKKEISEAKLVPIVEKKSEHKKNKADLNFPWFRIGVGVFISLLTVLVSSNYILDNFLATTPSSSEITYAAPEVNPTLTFTTMPIATEDATSLENIPIPEFCILEYPDISKFPDVNIVFRVLDQNLFPVKSIAEQSIRVSENGHAALPISNQIQIDTQRLGIDFYIIINRGNRTDQLSTKNVLVALLKYVDESKDRVFIFTDDGNRANLYYEPRSDALLSQVISDFPTNNIDYFRTSDFAVQNVLDGIETETNDCERQKFLFLILGDNALSESNFIEIGKRVDSSYTKLAFFHTPTKSGQMEMEFAYRNFTEQSNGYYVSLLDDVVPFFEAMTTFRQSYSVYYRSNIGETGTRYITLFNEDSLLKTKGLAYYSINLLSPQVSLILPPTIERMAVKADTTGYDYDKVSENGFIQVSFPDGFPRKITNDATLIISQLGASERLVPITLSPSIGDITGNVYKFSWNLVGFDDVSRTDLSVRIELVDELGVAVISSELPVVLISHLPLKLLTQRYSIYYLIGIALLLLAIFIFVRRRMLNSISVL